MSDATDKARPAYMDESWFALFESACAAHGVTAVAQRLDVTRTCASMVKNGIGPYGTGKASTARFAARVRQYLDGAFECPFLTTFAGEPRLITGEQCRGFAYREPPTSNPHEGRHWRACRTCPQRVPAPRHWDEQAARFIDPASLKAARSAVSTAQRAASKTAVAAADAVATQPTTAPEGAGEAE